MCIRDSNQDRVVVRLGKKDDLPFESMDYFTVGGRRIDGAQVNEVISTVKSQYSGKKFIFALSYVGTALIVVGIIFLILYFAGSGGYSTSLCVGGKCTVTKQETIHDAKYIFYGILSFVLTGLLFWLQVVLFKRILDRVHSYIDSENNSRWHPQGITWIFDDWKDEIRLQELEDIPQAQPEQPFLIIQNQNQQGRQPLLNNA
eukprot:TRINITY_DN2868_c0_g1_i1.p1 TRINITY_DN2868_c0_g1~~TRINITY_DN2868_c0_g1_i1.p1  ORF type:complete len:202 (+),score=58.66 TRINITY_DN2868_c0_g1_i1:64-669(+)